MKYRILRVVLWTGNHTLAWGLRHRLAPAAFALLETTGRRTGRVRHTVVGNGLDGDTFWVVAAHGMQSDYVRNLVRDARVRVLVHGAWRIGAAVVLADDDPEARSRTLRYQWDAALGRAIATTPLTVRVDLDRQAGAHCEASRGGHMAAGFHDGSRSLQDAFDTRALADRIDGLLVTDTISEGDRAFIEARDMFFLATADAEGRPTCSYKGGEPGFVRVLDPRTLVFPNYDGNGMYLSAGNVLVNPDVGMLFLDFERGHRMRLEGVAHIDLDDPLRADYPEAQFVVRVSARRVYPNCPRYIHRYQLVRRSRFVPRSDCLTPVPEWKRSEWAVDALPEQDPARDPGDREVLGR